MDDLTFTLKGKVRNQIKKISEKKGCSEDVVITNAIGTYINLNSSRLDGAKFFIKDKKGNLYEIKIK